MTIRIGDYEIKTLDEHNLGLIEHSVTKKSNIGGRASEGGKPKETIVGYHSRLDSALISLVNKHLRLKADISKAEHLLQGYEWLEASIKHAIKDIK